MDLKQDVINNMSQSELLTKLCWNSFKAFVTTIVLIAAFVKMMELMGFYGYISLGQVILFTGLTMGIYYYYFWKMQDRNTTPHLSDVPLTWRDFFYTTKIDADNQIICLATSWVFGAIVYILIAVVAYAIKFCLDNSGTGEVMSLLRVVVIGLIATTFYIYTQRNALKTNFWGIIIICTAYGFALSLSAYLLGVIIGISNMVFGVPITIAILVLQFTFTSVYTYMDLLEWAQQTHIKVVKTTPEVSEATPEAEVTDHQT
jgi:hypothetical protein